MHTKGSRRFLQWTYSLTQPPRTVGGPADNELTYCHKEFYIFLLFLAETTFGHNLLQQTNVQGWECTHSLIAHLLRSLKSNE